MVADLTTRNGLHEVMYVLFFALQVHGRCKKNNISGSKHYLTVASGVMMSVFVSPVIAAVTVGKSCTVTGCLPCTPNWKKEIFFLRCKCLISTKHCSLSADLTQQVKCANLTYHFHVE